MIPYGRIKYAHGQNRTADLWLIRPTLYRLSYASFLYSIFVSLNKVYFLFYL